MKLSELKHLKEMYTNELDDVHIYEGNPYIQELRKNELEFRIALVDEAIEKYENKKNKIVKKFIVISLIVCFTLAFAYLLF